MAASIFFLLYRLAACFVFFGCQVLRVSFPSAFEKCSLKPLCLGLARISDITYGPHQGIRKVGRFQEVSCDPLSGGRAILRFE